MKNINLNQLKSLWGQWEDRGVPVATSSELIIPHLIRLINKAQLRNDWLAENAYWRHISAFKGWDWCKEARKRMSSTEDYLLLMSELTGVQITNIKEIE